MLLRLLILTLVIYLALAGLRRLLRGRRPALEADGSVRMVRCRRCGLHVPEHEAVRQGEAYYCSREHSRRG